MKKRKEKRKYVARPGIEPRTPDLRVRCPTDCATRPGSYLLNPLKDFFRNLDQIVVLWRRCAEVIFNTVQQRSRSHLEVKVRSTCPKKVENLFMYEYKASSDGVQRIRNLTPPTFLTELCPFENFTTKMVNWLK